ncbi:MAG: hypothetical protein IJQ50_03220, partial [Clostridia bacterium]|nr:hypothetical protein [Clostridia bacterium]
MKTYDSEYNIVRGFYMRSLSFFKKHSSFLIVVTVFLIILAVFRTGTLFFGYDVFLGSNYLGTVSGRAETEASLAVINDSLDIPIKENLNFFPKIVIRGGLTPAAEVSKQIKLVSGQMHEGTGFTVDGETLFAVKESSDMLRLIDEYTAPYKTPYTTSAVLEGNIT